MYVLGRRIVLSDYAAASSATTAGGATSAAAKGVLLPSDAYVEAATEILDRLSAASSEVAALMAQADITSYTWQQQLSATLVPFEGLATGVKVLGDPAGFEAVHAKRIEATGAFWQGTLSFGQGVADSDLDALERASGDLAFGTTAVTEARILLQAAVVTHE